MPKHTAKITTKSIEQSGLPTEYKKAIAEYIWNGFDANATEVYLNFEGNSLGHLPLLSIIDNGTGINFTGIGETFGNFLDSIKRDPFDRENFQKGRKGKGRYAFNNFAERCIWETKYKGADDQTYRYTLIINKGNLQNFTTENHLIAPDADTGTVVSLQNCFNLSSILLSSKDFEDYLSSEFGWFLFLNKERGCNIFINGVKLAYDEIIGDSEEQEMEIGEYVFKVTFIRWNLKIGDKYYFYFRNQHRKEAAKKHTSFNNKAIDFHHSVYIESLFFDNFQETLDDNPVLGFYGTNQSDPAFKNLVKELTSLLSEKEKHFIRDVQADRLIEEFNYKGILPDIKDRTSNLESAVKEIYCADPRILHSLNFHQSRTLIGMINLLLATDLGPSLLELIEGFVTLTDEERENLSRALLS